MKYSLLTIFALSAALLVSCNKEKAAIDANKDAAKTAIDQQKKAVDANA